MNQEIKQRWVSALRSGKYQQGQGQLRDNNGYCCLGVLCDLWVREGHGRWDLIKDMWWVTNGSRSNTTYTVLPLAVQEWAGLSSESPKIGGSNQSLIWLNDKASYDFNQIAAVIEIHL